MPQGGELFIGYPVSTVVQGGRTIDAVYVSPSRGVVVFDLVEGPLVGDFERRQDDAATALEVRLKQHRELVDRRTLLIPIHTVTFAPGANTLPPSDESYHVADSASLADLLNSLTWDDADDALYRQTISALQSISGIRRSAAVRVAKDNDSRGAKLKRLEGSIATLDSQQSRAVIETARDVQRIRGLAGSGRQLYSR